MEIVLLDPIHHEYLIKMLADEGTKVYVIPIGDADKFEKLQKNVKFEILPQYPKKLPSPYLIITSPLKEEYLKQFLPNLIESERPLVIGLYGKDIDLELDRKYGKEVAKRYGFKVKPYFEFKSSKEVLDFMRKNKDKRWVIKLSGIISLTYKVFDFKHLETYEHLFSMAEEVLGIGEEKDFTILVEEYVDGFDSDVDYIYSYNKPLLSGMVFEYKKQREKGLGIMTGEMGSVVMFIPITEPIARWHSSVLPFFSGKRAYIATGMRYSYEDGNIYFLEWTARFIGFPCSIMYFEIVRSCGISITDFFKKWFHSEEFPDDWIKKITSKVSVSNRLYSPYHSNMFGADLLEVPIRLKGNLNPSVDEIFETMPSLLSNVVRDGDEMVVIGIGNTLREAIQDMNSKLSKLDINYYRRSDIGENLLEGDADRLYKSGWISYQTYRKLKE